MKYPIRALFGTPLLALVLVAPLGAQSFAITWDQARAKTLSDGNQYLLPPKEASTNDKGMKSWKAELKEDPAKGEILILRANENPNLNSEDKWKKATPIDLVANNIYQIVCDKFSGSSFSFLFFLYEPGTIIDNTGITSGGYVEIQAKGVKKTVKNSSDPFYDITEFKPMKIRVFALGRERKNIDIQDKPQTCTFLDLEKLKKGKLIITRNSMGIAP